MQVQFTGEQVQAKAVQLGVIQHGEELPRHLRSRVLAALISEQAPRFAQAAVPPIAESIRVQPCGPIEVDGQPFPWLVQADRIEVSLQPDGSGTVRLTLPARNIQIIPPADESE